MNREKVIHSVERMPEVPEPPDRAGEAISRKEVQTVIETVNDDTVRPFVYRPPVGQQDGTGIEHPNRRRTDLSTTRGN